MKSKVGYENMISGQIPQLPGKNEIAPLLDHLLKIDLDMFTGMLHHLAVSSISFS